MKHLLLWFVVKYWPLHPPPHPFLVIYFQSASRLYLIPSLYAEHSLSSVSPMRLAFSGSLYCRRHCCMSPFSQLASDDFCAVMLATSNCLFFRCWWSWKRPFNRIQTWQKNTCTNRHCCGQTTLKMEHMWKWPFLVEAPHSYWAALNWAKEKKKNLCGADLAMIRSLLFPEPHQNHSSYIFTCATCK